MWLISWLDFIGSGLLLAGLVWGALSLIGTRSRLEQERAAAREIHKEWTEAFRRHQEYDTDAESRKRGVRKGVDGNSAASLLQDVELMIVNYLRPQLRGPFVVAALGTLFSFVRALLLVCGVGS